MRKSKKAAILVIITILTLLSTVGCGGIKIVDDKETVKPFWEKSSELENTVGTTHEYNELPNGTYEVKCNTCNQTHTYKYKISITGRMNNAAKNSTFTYLSNLESITFDQAWKASGLSSNTSDYFLHLEAILVNLE